MYFSSVTEDDILRCGGLPVQPEDDTEAPTGNSRPGSEARITGDQSPTHQDHLRNEVRNTV